MSIPRPTLVLELFVQTSLVLVVLSAAGYAVASLARRVTASSATSLVVTPLLALWPVFMLCWWWGRFVGRGIGLLLPIAVLSLACVGAFFAARNARASGLHATIRSTLPSLGIASFIGCAYVVLYRRFFSLDHLSAASLRNYDLPHLAIISEHLRRNGFDDPSNITYGDLSEYVKRDVFGTFVFDLLPATLLRAPVWTTAAAVVLSAWILVGLQLRRLLLDGMGATPMQAFVGAAVAACSPLFFYVVGNGFLSQTLAIALLTAASTTYLALQQGRIALGHATLLLAIVTAALWFVYPFTVLVVPLFGVAVWLWSARSLHDMRLALLAKATVGQLLLSALLVNDRLVFGVDSLLSQGSTKPGWPLPGLGLAKFLGVDTQFDHTHAGPWWTVMLAVVVLIVVRVWLRRSEIVVTATGAVAVALGSYACLLVVYGTSYQQWKWAALVSPVAIAALTFLVVRGVNSLEPPWWRAFGSALLITGVVGYLYSTQALAANGFTDADARWVRTEVADLDESNTLAEKGEVSLRLDAWDAMWITSFYPDVKMNQLSHWSYYPMYRDTGEHTWVLESFADATAPERVVAVRDLSSTFRLVQIAPKGPGQTAVESVDFSGYPNVRWTVRVTNTGNAPMVSPSDDATNGVYVDVFFTGTARHRLEIKAHIPLPANTVVQPGESTMLQGETEIDHNSPFLLQFDLSSGSIGAYEAWDDDSFAVVGRRAE